MACRRDFALDRAGLLQLVGGCALDSAGLWHVVGILHWTGLVYGNVVGGFALDSAGLWHLVGVLH